MNTLIAACGLDCAKCEAYIATQNNDEAAKESIAARWRVEYKSPEITVETVNCDGCMVVGGRAGGYCGMCQVRSCCLERNLPNCAHCADYACEALQQFFAMAPGVQTTLDEIRLGMG